MRYLVDQFDNMKENRDFTYDIIRGFLIILVVIGHSIQTAYRSTDMNCWYNPVFNVIYTFHMPLFLFISGFFLNKSLRHEFVDLLAKKTKRLLFPVLFYSSLLIFISVIINGDYSISLKFVYKQFTYYWFLICLFVVTLFYYLFYKANTSTKGILFLAYLGGVFLYDYLPDVILKDCQVIRHILIFGFGMYMGICGVYKFEAFKLIIIIVCLLAIVLDRMSWGFNMMDYPAYIRIFDQFTCTIVAFLLFKSIIPLINSLIQFKPLVYLGQNSLSIYLIHMLFPRIMLYTGFQIAYTFNNVFILTISWLLVSILVTEIIRRIARSYSFVFGV